MSLFMPFSICAIYCTLSDIIDSYIAAIQEQKEV